MLCKQYDAQGAYKLGENHNVCPSHEVVANTKHKPSRSNDRPASQWDGGGIGRRTLSSSDKCATA